MDAEAPHASVNIGKTTSVCGGRSKERGKVRTETTFTLGQQGRAVMDTITCYTGTLIKDLIAAVEGAESKAPHGRPDKKLYVSTSGPARLREQEKSCGSMFHTTLTEDKTVPDGCLVTRA